jgi:hypothetical protein
VAAAKDGARFDPYMEISPPGAIPAYPLAALTTPAVEVVGRGAAATTSRLAATDAEPPGFVTATAIEPGAAMAPAVMEARSELELTKVVAIAEPAHWIDAPARKPEPFTVKVKAGPPAVTDDGAREVIDGVGALTVSV